ncbi:MAG TPA: MFS transporter [Acidobacteriaceae bacterium]
MPFARHFRSLNSVQRNTFAACFLGWTLDAFDFFLLTFCLKAIAVTFHTGVERVTEAIFWTLVMRPVGAFIFGAMAEKVGRRPTLMVNVVAFSFFELASAFAPSLHSFLVFRALFGIAMGGVWGVGAALALETLPPEGRGFFSGALQQGYVVGNLLAAALFGLLFSHLHGTGVLTNWRVMFMLGALPALLAFYLRFGVKESPAWIADQQVGATNIKPKLTLSILVSYLPIFVFLVVLMTAFNSFSHGTQDLYPTFLIEHGLSDAQVGLVAAISNLGALLGGMSCGALSETFGRRRTILMAALLSIPMVPLWAWSHSAVLLAVGGFLMQFMVQGAWGIVPAHLNELAPAPVRAILPGFAYQLGNLISSRNSVFQKAYANHHNGGQLNVALSGTVIIVAILVASITAFGPEAKGASLGDNAS